MYSYVVFLYATNPEYECETEMEWDEINGMYWHKARVRVMANTPEL